MEMETLFDDADRVAATDLYPARCRKVVADLAAALRETALELKGSREYGLALECELKARAEQTDAFVALATSMDADFEAATRPRGGTMTAARDDLAALSSGGSDTPAEPPKGCLNDGGCQ